MGSFTVHDTFLHKHQFRLITVPRPNVLQIRQDFVAVPVLLMAELEEKYQLEFSALSCTARRDANVNRFIYFIYASHISMRDDSRKEWKESKERRGGRDGNMGTSVVKRMRRKPRNGCHNWDIPGKRPDFSSEKGEREILRGRDLLEGSPPHTEALPHRHLIRNLYNNPIIIIF